MDLEYFASEILAFDVDIICLQEIHYLSDLDNQVKRLASLLGFEHFFVFDHCQSHIDSKFRCSVAVISKYPIVETRKIMLSNPKLLGEYKGHKVSSDDKGFAEVIVDVEGKTLRVLSGHMLPFHIFDKDFMDDSFFDIRKEIQDIILSLDVPTVVGVDLNYENHIALLPNVLNLGFVNALPLDETEPRGRAIDKILVSKEWKVLESKIVKGKADHYLCVADLELL